MTALANAKQLLTGTLSTVSVPLATQKVWLGGMACLNSTTGLVQNGASGNANLVFIGNFAETADNTAGAAPTAMVRLQHEVAVTWFANATGANALTASELFTDCYILDDQTVTKSSSGNSKAGRVWAVSTADGVAVESYTL